MSIERDREKLAKLKKERDDLVKKRDELDVKQGVKLEDVKKAQKAVDDLGGQKKAVQRKISPLDSKIAGLETGIAREVKAEEKRAKKRGQS